MKGTVEPVVGKGGPRSTVAPRRHQRPRKHYNNVRRPDPIRSGFGYAKRGPEPADQFLFEVCENRTEDRGVLPETGERHAARASEGQTCFAKAEERQHSTDSGIEINSN